MSRKTEEILTGILLGLIFSLLFAIKVLASPVSDAEDYLEENQIEIPSDVQEACEYFGKKYDICPETLEAICWVESRCIPTVQSSDKSCKGLMQIKPSCHSDRMNRLNAKNVFGVWDNIEIGTDYLKELMNGEGDIGVALAIYNGQSESKIEKARKGEYSEYVKKILTISEALERVHEK